MSTSSPATFQEDSAGSDGIAVALVVDNPEILRQLRDALGLGGFTSVIEVETIDALASLRASDEVDAIVLRVGMSRGEVLEGFAAARSRFPKTAIVGLWPDNQRREDGRALKAGVDGLLQEGHAQTALSATVHAVCSGLVCFPRKVPATAQGEALTTREKQVLGMLIMGFSNAEIGRRLYLAESTVKSHLSCAYMKLGVRSRKDAATLILDPDSGLGTGILSISGG